MSSSPFSDAELLLADLIHDLRQDLGNIETSVYCLNLVADSGEPRPERARDYLHTIEEQVARASQRLSAAATQLTQLRAQRTEPLETLDRTNSTTSAVT